MIRIARLIVRLAGGPGRRPLLIMLSGLALVLLSRRRRMNEKARGLVFTIGLAAIVAGLLFLVLGVS
ncbi:hypothetical protein [Lacticaseibacillus camelliae]|uniref:hypothetical protein n=1 Tax=Lacticaseibacillus camelliae TaxID=381742 RepID=UPI0006D24552|nr:hypothetical protein [Lacticaseibacillus camelliae]